MTALSHMFTVRRRFMRSVNLERDGDNPESLDGYVLTSRNVRLAERIFEAYAEPHRTRAWTFTGVYGTGKSSFANLLSALCAGKNQPVGRAAWDLVNAQEADGITQGIPDDGLVRAVVTARRESLRQTIIRGLALGCERFWGHRPGRKPGVVNRVLELADSGAAGLPADVDVAELARGVAEASGTGLLLIIDELGKVLEHAVRTAGREDLYLLQRLAELPAGPEDPPVLTIGLLHQAFSEYGHLLSSAEQAEWGKIQGRFEDVPFAEPADQMLRIVGHAISFHGDTADQDLVSGIADAWSNRLEEASPGSFVSEVLSAERCQEVLPLHPITALVLPNLCSRYGQNERSLFTFLASGEPNTLQRFLEETEVPQEGTLPLLRLPAVYDYFVDVANLGGANRVQMSRWSEVHTVVNDARGLHDDAIAALKTVGTLNLVSSSGPLRATRALVRDALTEDPAAEGESDHWDGVLEELVEKGFLTYRTQVDEYRVWQGSDFDIDAAVQEKLEGERRGLGAILQSFGTSAPVVAQRHSYQTGTLRYFDRRFVDKGTALTKLESKSRGSDGLIAYWVGEELPEDVPSATTDGLPLVLLATERIQPLRSAALELAALLQVEKTEAALQADGVGRTELKKRISLARGVLDRAMREAFDDVDARMLWARGERVDVGNFNALLSDLMDTWFTQGPVLWNELINRRKLTSQGSKAQRELITALLESWDEPRLGIDGTGPDFSIYSSVLAASGIHKKVDAEWVLGPPKDSPEVCLEGVWDAIERFCLNAVEEPRSIAELYKLLDRPPYGVKDGLIPVLLAAVLLHRSEDVSVYQEGSFVPVLTPAHFELLVKRPERFTVKHFELGGVRFSEYRQMLEQIGAVGESTLSGVRNETLLNVVRPLIQFAVALPGVTKRSRKVSETAQAVRDALLTSREPDELVFDALPSACGFDPFRPGQKGSTERRRRFLRELGAVLQELRQHYEELLRRCEQLVHHAFGVQSSLEKLREDLRVRAQYLAGKVIEPRLRSFILAAIDESVDNQEWLESIVMIVADRPAETWSDDDITSFELNLGEMARRFKNLEALRSDAAAAGGREGFEAKRISLTAASGRQTNRVVWVDQAADEKITQKANELLDSLEEISEAHLREAILARMLEKTFGHDSEAPASDGASITGEEKKYA